MEWICPVIEKNLPGRQDGMSKTEKPSNPLDDALYGCPKERRGYAKHFDSVYAPMLRRWIDEMNQASKMKSCKDESIAFALASLCPEMLNALPSRLISKERDSLLVAMRMSAMTASSGADSTEEWQIRWEKSLVEHKGVSLARCMFLYRLGYDTLHFNFYGGGDEGCAENAEIEKGAKVITEDDFAEAYPDVGISLQEISRSVLPSGFGNDEPYYRDGKCIITLNDLNCNLESDVEVKRYDSVEWSGNISGGINIPYPE